MDYEAKYNYSSIPYSRSEFIKTFADDLYEARTTMSVPEYPEMILHTGDEKRMETMFGDSKKILSNIVEIYPKYRKKIYRIEDISDEELNLHLMKYEPKFVFDNTVIDKELIGKMKSIEVSMIGFQIDLYNIVETIMDQAKKQRPVHVYDGEIQYLEDMLELLRKLVSIIITEILPYLHSELFINECKNGWMDGGTNYSWIETIQHRLGIIQCWIYEMKAHDPYSEESRQDLIHRTDDILYDLDYTAAIKEKYNGKRSI